MPANSAKRRTGKPSAMRINRLRLCRSEITLAKTAKLSHPMRTINGAVAIESGSRVSSDAVQAQQTNNTPSPIFFAPVKPATPAPAADRPQATVTAGPVPLYATKYRHMPDSHLICPLTCPPTTPIHPSTAENRTKTEHKRLFAYITVGYYASFKYCINLLKKLAFSHKKPPQPIDGHYFP